MSSSPTVAAQIAWSGKTVDVISLGCGEQSLLSQEAIKVIADAEQLYGSAHQLEEVAHIETRADKIYLPSPFSDLGQLLEQNQDRQIVVLASGDALFYGIGSWLIRALGSSNLNFYPNISSIQHCFHGIGLPLDQAKIVSLHGRPLAVLRRCLRHRQVLAVFTDSVCDPKAIAGELCDQGFDASTIWVGEALGSGEQQIEKYLAHELVRQNRPFHPLNVCVIALSQDPGTTDPLPTFPGIPDQLFSTGAEPGFGMISKREVRLTILSMMQPCPGEIAWDIGAGCGSVSVEWARWNSQGQIYAIEQSKPRIEHIEINSDRFGTVLNLNPIHGVAPECCQALADPDCVFIGGSGGLQEILQFAWDRLKPGGKLVASAVTAASIEAMEQFLINKPGREWIRIQVDKNLPGQIDTRTLAPAIIGKCVKPAQPI